MITYIKQCEASEEIQKWWFPDICDLYYDKSEKKTKPITFLAEKIWLTERTRGCNFIWLPTQEQLQEMVDRDWYKVFCKFLLWHWNSEPNAKEFASMFNSMNEVWLAFVMKEKYNKIWTGEKWETA